MNDWIKAALVRAVKTAAQTAVALIGTNAIGITTVDWAAVASAAALAAVVSVLTSVAGIPEVREGKSPLEGR
jgi:conserved domain protein